MRSRRPKELAVATAAAALFSGVPSTTWTLLTGGDLLESTRAAATILPTHRDEPSAPVGIAVHLAISMAWTAALRVLVPKRGAAAGALVGAVAGLGIAALDLGVIAPRHFPAIAALPQGPQWADHVAFGAIAGGVLGRERH